jgi:uncharacterized membrane protein YtjA (UPF0391 family)
MVPHRSAGAQAALSAPAVLGAGPGPQPTVARPFKCRAARSTPVLHYAVVFLVIALIAAVLGFSGIAASAAGIAKILFIVFLVLALASFLFGILRGG